MPTIFPALLRKSFSEDDELRARKYIESVTVTKNSFLLVFGHTFNSLANSRSSLRVVIVVFGRFPLLTAAYPSLPFLLKLTQILTFEEY